jgi:hypothetical protein
MLSGPHAPPPWDHSIGQCWQLDLIQNSVEASRGISTHIGDSIQLAGERIKQLKLLPDSRFKQKRGSGFADLTLRATPPNWVASIAQVNDTGLPVVGAVGKTLTGQRACRLHRAQASTDRLRRVNRIYYPCNALPLSGGSATPQEQRKGSWQKVTDVACQGKPTECF